MSARPAGRADPVAITVGAHPAPQRKAPGTGSPLGSLTRHRLLFTRFPVQRKLGNDAPKDAHV